MALFSFTLFLPFILFQIRYNISLGCVRSIDDDGTVYIVFFYITDNISFHFILGVIDPIDISDQAISVYTNKDHHQKRCPKITFTGAQNKSDDACYNGDGIQNDCKNKHSDIDLIISFFFTDNKINDERQDTKQAAPDKSQDEISVLTIRDNGADYSKQY